MAYIKRASCCCNRIFWHIGRDRTASSNDGPYPNSDWCNKGGVRSNRCAVTNQCTEFSKPVIVTGDCASAYIYVFTNGGVTKIGQVVGFAADANCGIFCFDKITYFDTVLKDCSLPQAREWANGAARPKNCPVNVRKGPNN